MPEPFESLKGQFLLDGGQLGGSIFNRAVVLICQHDEEGAFGLILNQSLDAKVGDMLAVDLPASIKEQTFYRGGPVQPGALTYLHADSCLLDANVMPNLSLGHSLDDLVELAESFSPSRKLRCFAGYAGWTAGQLESEMRRKAWLTHPASIDLIFKSDPGDLWREILKGKGWKYRLLTEAPNDLSSN